MTQPDMPALIDQLGAASLEAREMLADVRSTTRELRAVIREAAAERERIEAVVRRTVQDEIRQEVKSEMASLGEQIKTAFDRASTKAVREFERLTNLVMTGDDYARRSKGALDLRDLARQGRRERGGGS